MTPDAPRNESGLIQMIMIGKSIRQIWVNVVIPIFRCSHRKLPQGRQLPLAATCSVLSPFVEVGDSEKVHGGVRDVGAGSEGSNTRTSEYPETIYKIIEPPRGKTNNVVSEKVRHKPTCTSTEKS